MAIDYPAVLELREEGRRFEWTEREVMLYAVGVGMGADPLDEKELRYVYERDLCVLPTFASVAAWGAGITPERIGLDRRRTLHGEEQTVLHRPIPLAGSIVADSRVIAIYDKGADKGAVVVRETVLKSADDGEPIATLTRTAFARGDGGFGGPEQGGTSAPQRPARAADRTIDLPTRHDLALLYRLSGDRNPLHADPQVARAAGFERPILHGLCTYGLTCRAVLQAFCDYDASRIASHGARFSAPVLPGDTVSVDMWQEGKTIFFEARVNARDVVVIKNGMTVLR
ncbi:MAG: MaoC/PaaZ C-terminal domain-containing protein [Pseudomonas sp.]|uniref:MaoC/PaaZ C-terminal domain-containing protein n=1 Tax=Pseudomonas sp. TaxID=306 RepID=UPI003981FFAF